VPFVEALPYWGAIIIIAVVLYALFTMGDDN
jgi:hypothetical protein